MSPRSERVTNVRPNVIKMKTRKSQLLQAALTTLELHKKKQKLCILKLCTFGASVFGDSECTQYSHLTTCLQSRQRIIVFVWHWTSTNNFHPRTWPSVKMKQCAEYVHAVQRCHLEWFRITRTHRHTYRTDCYTWTTKLADNTTTTYNAHSFASVRSYCSVYARWKRLASIMSRYLETRLPAPPSVDRGPMQSDWPKWIDNLTGVLGAARSATRHIFFTWLKYFLYSSACAQLLQTVNFPPRSSVPH